MLLHGMAAVTLVCLADPPGGLDGDRSVGIEDFLALLGAWGSCSDCGTPLACPADLDGDCSVGIIDLLMLLGNWG